MRAKQRKADNAERKNALKDGAAVTSKKRVKQTAEQASKKAQRRLQQQGVKDTQLPSSIQQQESVKQRQASSHAAGPRQQLLQQPRAQPTGMDRLLTQASKQQHKHMKHKQAKLQLEGRMSKKKKTKRKVVEQQQ